MRDRSIRFTMGLVFATLVFIGGLSVGVSLWGIQTQQHDALVTNLAGRERMLSQKLAKEAWWGLARGQAPQYLVQMHATARQFEEGLQALVHGGQVAYAGTTVSLPPATDPSFRAALEEVAATWEPLHTAAHAVLENEPGSPAFTEGAAELERLSSVALEKIDTAVRLYQAAAEGRVVRLRWIQLAFLLAGGMVVILGYGLTLAQVLRPVSALETAVQRMEQGDLDYPVQVRVRNELGRLAGAFGDMRGRIKARIQEQSALLRLSQALVSETDPQAIIDQAVRMAAQALQMEFAAIALADEDGQSYSGRAGVGWPPEVLQRTKRLSLNALPGLHHAIRTRAPVVIPDESRETRFGTPPWITLMGITSSLFVPMLVAGEAIGGMIINTRAVRHWSDDDVRLLSLMANDTAQALERAREHQAVKEAEARYRGLFDGVPVGLYRTTPTGQILDANPALVEMLGYPNQEAFLALSAAEPYVDPEDRARWRATMEREGIVRDFETRFRRRDGRVIWVRDSARAIRDADGRVLYYEGATQDITQRKQAEEALRHRADQLETITRVGREITTVPDLQPVLTSIAHHATELSQADASGVFAFRPDGRLYVVAAYGVGDEFLQAIAAEGIPLGQGAMGRAAAEGRPVQIPDILTEPGYPYSPLAEMEHIRAILAVPMLRDAEVVGGIVLWHREPRHFAPEEVAFLQALAQQSVNAVENARLFEALQTRVHELSTLAEVSAALRGAATVQEIAQCLAADAARLTQADVAILCLVDEARQRIVTLGVAGLPSEAVGRQQSLDEGITAQVVRTGAVYRSSDLAQDPVAAHPDLLAGLGPGVCVPLRTTEGKVVGTLLVARRRKSRGEVAPFSQGEEGLLTTLAEIAGNALQRARTHEELEEAYVQTVLALAAAMDVRDAYTADHSQRMAAWAQATARELGCREEEVQTIRWAAWLHDIGKIGVPDEVLHKPGPLAEQEWVMMRRHPQIGAEIVAPVKRLAHVAPIIRAHQEHWDGTGYPDGLRGEAIPLGARILAVVDAYGAITDDRVYRKARSHEEAVAELRRCTGTQFDPRVVETFLQVLGQDVDITGGGGGVFWRQWVRPVAVMEPRGREGSLSCLRRPQDGPGRADHRQHRSCHLPRRCPGCGGAGTRSRHGSSSCQGGQGSGVPGRRLTSTLHGAIISAMIRAPVSMTGEEQARPENGVSGLTKRFWHSGDRRRTKIGHIRRKRHER